MANKYAVASGLWSATSTWSNSDGGAAGATVPANNDTVFILAGVAVKMDVDQSGFADGINGLTIRGVAVGTPGMLYFKSGSNGYLKMKTNTALGGTNLAVFGRLLANHDGVWGNTGAVAAANYAHILLAAAAYVNGQYLDINLYAYHPTTKYLTTYGSKFTVTASSATSTFTTSVAHGFTRTTPVAFRLVGAGSLPAPLREGCTYRVSYNPTTYTFTLATQDAGNTNTRDIVLTSDGSGTIEVYNGHQSTSTPTINVFEDVTAETGWSTTANMNMVVLANSYGTDLQFLTLSSISSSSVQLSANVDSIQYPYSYVVLRSRNVAIRAIAAMASLGGMVNRLAKTSPGACVLDCEMSDVSISTAIGAGVALRNGNASSVLSGVVSGTLASVYDSTDTVFSGLSTGVNRVSQSNTNVSLTGMILGANYIIYTGRNSIFSGFASGVNNGCYGDVGLVINGATGRGALTVVNAVFGVSISNSDFNQCQGAIQNVVGATIASSRFECVSVYFVYACSDIYVGPDVTVYGSNVLFQNSSGRCAATASIMAYVTYLSSIELLGVTINAASQTSRVFWGAGARARNCTLTATSPLVGEYLSNSSNHNMGVFLFDEAGVAGDMRGWNSGGLITTETYSAGTHGTPPVTLAKVYKNTFEAAYSNGIDIPLMGRRNVPTRIKVYIKKSTASMTTSPYVKLCDPSYGFEAAGEQLAISSAADNTDWQTLVVEYTPTYDKPLVLRIGGVNASGYFYWNWEQGSSSSWGNTLLGG